METVKSWILVALFLGISAMAVADPIDRKTLIYLQIDDTDLQIADQLIIQQTLMSNLINQDIFQVLQHPGELPSPEEMDQTAVFAGADSWVHIEISGSLETLLVNWKIMDVQEQEILSVNFFQNNIDPSYLTLYGSFWNVLVDDLESRLIPIEITGRLELHARPGSELSGIGEEIYLVNEEGILELTLSAPASYSLGLKLPGFYNEQVRFYLEKDEVEVLEIRQKKENNLSLYGGLYMFGFPSLAVQYQIPKTQIITALGVDLFFLGFIPGNTENSDENPQIIGGNGLFYANYQAGYQFETKKGFFSYPVNIGAFMRFTPLDDTISIVDPLIPWGFYISGAVEYDIRRNLSISFQWKPTVYYTQDAMIYQSSFEDRQIQMGENLMLDIPIFVLGVRWYP